MVLLKDSSRSIQYEAFHVFKARGAAGRGRELPKTAVCARRPRCRRLGAQPETGAVVPLISLCPKGIEGDARSTGRAVLHTRTPPHTSTPPHPHPHIPPPPTAHTCARRCAPSPWPRERPPPARAWRPCWARCRWSCAPRWRLSFGGRSRCVCLLVCALACVRGVWGWVGGWGWGARACAPARPSTRTPTLAPLLPTPAAPLPPPLSGLLGPRLHAHGDESLHPGRR